MALLGSGRKLRSLDAICAKLKQEAESTPDSNEEENSQDVPKIKEAETNGKNEDKEENEYVEQDVNEIKKNLNETGTKFDLTKVKKVAKENIENGIKNDKEAHENFDKETEGCEKEECSNTKTNESKILEHSQNVDSTPTEYNCRKGRRKASTPRSITQVQKLYNQFDIDEKDELAEYEINNLNTNFPPDDEELDDSEERQSSPSSSIQGSSVSFGQYTKEIQDANNSSDTSKHSKEKASNHSKELSSSMPVTHSNLASSPLDLSISNDFDDNEDEINSTSVDLSVRSSNDCEKDSSISEDKMSSPADSKSESGDHAANLKDYAENTMNELLSMYGLGGAGEGGVGEIESLAGQVPLKNFTQMLQKVYNQMGTPLGAKIPIKIPLQGLVDERTSGNVTGSSSLGKQQKGIYANYVQNSTTVGVSKSEVIKSGDKFINSSSNAGLFSSKPSLVAKGPVLSPAATSPVSLQIQGGKFPLPDYTKYLKRYVSGKECGGSHCQDLGYKEHYHCLDCSFQVFVKKEEMVRHFKWHKKRDESLQHGFMRYSPLDSCVEKFGPCTHNGRQTHYHCLQPGCDKVYISTSDVQMHANYHRKDSAIIQEGFQRFRATEDCGTPSCTFYGQRTTHFHCRRSSCYFTFKNKADMEKHKTYHQKDEILSKDGFKKFMKYEHCAHNSCRYSKVSNHIHCIRPGCDYVLHSTAQLYSHKRKHERKDFENAYKRYREEHTKPQFRPAPTNNSNQNQEPGTPLQNHKTQMVLQAVPMLSNVIGGLLTTGAFRQPGSPVNEPFELKRIKVEPEDISMSSSPIPEDFSSSAAGEMSNAVTPSETDFSDSNLDDEMSDTSQMSSLADKSSEISRDKLNDSLNLPIPLIGKKEMKREESLSPTSSMPNTLNIPLTQSLTNTPLISPEATVLQPPRTVYTERREKDDSWKSYLVRYTANDPCNPRCQYLYKDHYHCKIEGCLVLFKSKDGVREHARFHELQDRITPIAYRYYDQENLCPENCQYSLKEKHYHCIWSGCTHVVPHIGPTFGRLEHYRVHEYNRAAAGKTYSRPTMRVDDNGIKRRGRPPKYPRNEIPTIPKVSLSEEEIHRLTQASRDGENMVDKKVINGFRMFTKDDPCPDDQCVYLGMVHYHCARPRCYTSTDRLDVLNLHAKDFHSFVKILDGFEFFDRNVSCRRPHCQNNKTNRHFHCIRPKCDYSFVRHSTMAQHDKKHTAAGLKLASIPAIKTEAVSSNFVPIVPATTSSVASLVKTSGTYFPINTFSPIQNIAQSIAQGSIAVPVASSLVNASSTSGNPTTIQTSLTISPMQALTATPSSTQFVTAITSITAPLVTTLPVAISSGNTTVPLTVLLQQKTENHIPQPSWSFLKNKMHYALDQNCGRPFCKLKKKDHFHCLECNQAFSDPARLRSHIGKHGIKLKRSEIGTRVVKPNIPVTIAPRPPPPVTMVTTQNVVTNAAILHKLPLVKSRSGEGGLEEEETQNEEDEDVEDGGEINPSSSLTLNPSTFSNLIAKAQEENRINTTENLDDYEEEEPQDSDSGYQPNGEIGDEDSRESFDAEFSTKKDFSRRSGRKRIATKHNDFVDSNSINIKQRRVSSPRAKDDSVPEGYSRFRYNEDCEHFKCTYRQNVTHFHCMRSDCGYGFSDRSRLVQHTLRHERIDSITGGEMQQYRINQDCSSDCEFKNKMSHFHCLRCSYICTDSSKVLTHRKQHAKWDSINNQGFRKYSTTDNCGVLMCIFKRKQTHYHCTSTDCQYAVLSPAQMAPHKMKHVTMNS
ncbi:hypothetical protein ACJMK2_008299 [Sinanodonta woodiana]|uniref:C2H2-type domain-containing protein n=1 Tax=Sinanodonta woodiana TaxID=1069815 RepID=A0ABD3VL60_SINWO